MYVGGTYLTALYVCVASVWPCWIKTTIPGGKKEGGNNLIHPIMHFVSVHFMKLNFSANLVLSLCEHFHILINLHLILMPEWKFMPQNIIMLKEIFAEQTDQSIH